MLCNHAAPWRRLGKKTRQTAEIHYGLNPKGCYSKKTLDHHFTTRFTAQNDRKKKLSISTSFDFDEKGLRKICPLKPAFWAARAGQPEAPCRRPLAIPWAPGHFSDSPWPGATLQPAWAGPGATRGVATGLEAAPEHASGRIGGGDRRWRGAQHAQQPSRARHHLPTRCAPPTARTRATQGSSRAG